MAIRKMGFFTSAMFAEAKFVGADIIYFRVEARKGWGEAGAPLRKPSGIYACVSPPITFRNTSSKLDICRAPIVGFHAGVEMLDVV